MFFVIVAVIVALVFWKYRPKTYTTPEGKTYDLFTDALSQPHLLIAGATGSGKSVLINGLIATILTRLPLDMANGSQMILIDPKRVELSQYRDLPHTVTHAGGYHPEAWIEALQQAVSIMDARYTKMERQGKRIYSGGDLYIIIDEWASVYKSEVGKQAYKLILRLTSEGRAAKVHVILATQVPKANIIPTEIRENMTARFALHTANAVQSRIILEMNGCETLPRYGQGFYQTPEDTTLWNIPYITEAEITRLINYWNSPDCHRAA